MRSQAATRSSPRGSRTLATNLLVRSASSPGASSRGWREQSLAVISIRSVAAPIAVLMNSASPDRRPRSAELKACGRWEQTASMPTDFSPRPSGTQTAEPTLHARVVCLWTRPSASVSSVTCVRPVRIVSPQRLPSIGSALPTCGARCPDPLTKRSWCSSICRPTIAPSATSTIATSWSPTRCINCSGIDGLANQLVQILRLTGHGRVIDRHFDFVEVRLRTIRRP